MLFKKTTKINNMDLCENMNVMIKLPNKTIDIKCPFYTIPRIGEIIQYNGVRFKVLDIVHHYSLNFKAMLEFRCEEIVHSFLTEHREMKK